MEGIFSITLYKYREYFYFVHWVLFFGFFLGIIFNIEEGSDKLFRKLRISPEYTDL
jgi:hypothetical protein